MEYIAQLIEQIVPGSLRKEEIPLHRVPYPEHIDMDFPYPRNYRIPDFTNFSREHDMTPMEHIIRFTHKSDKWRIMNG